MGRMKDDFIERTGGYRFPDPGFDQLRLAEIAAIEGKGKLEPGDIERLQMLKGVTDRAGNFSDELGLIDYDDLLDEDDLA